MTENSFQDKTGGEIQGVNNNSDDTDQDDFLSFLAGNKTENSESQEQHSGEEKKNEEDNEFDEGEGLPKPNPEYLQMYKNVPQDPVESAFPKHMNEQMNSFSRMIFHGISAPFQCFRPVLAAIGLSQSTIDEDLTVSNVDKTYYKEEEDMMNGSNSVMNTKTGGPENNSRMHLLKKKYSSQDSDDDSGGVDDKYDDDDDDENDEYSHNIQSSFYFNYRADGAEVSTHTSSKSTSKHHINNSVDSRYQEQQNTASNSRNRSFSSTSLKFQENDILTEDEIKSLKNYEQNKYISIGDENENHDNHRDNLNHIENLGHKNEFSDNNQNSNDHVIVPPPPPSNEPLNPSLSPKISESNTPRSNNLQKINENTTSIPPILEEASIPNAIQDSMENQTSSIQSNNAIPFADENDENKEIDENSEIDENNENDESQVIDEQDFESALDHIVSRFEDDDTEEDEKIKQQNIQENKEDTQMNEKHQTHIDQNSNENENHHSNDNDHNINSGQNDTQATENDKVNETEKEVGETEKEVEETENDDDDDDDDEGYQFDAGVQEEN